jgi:hypothetical protein
VIAYDTKLRLGVEGGAGMSADLLVGVPTASVQLSAGYEPGTAYLRLDATSLMLPTNANMDFSSNTPPEAGWRVGTGVAFDGHVGVAATAGVGVFHQLRDIDRPCDSRQPVFTAIVGVRLLGKRLGVFVHPRIEAQKCIIVH